MRNDLSSILVLLFLFGCGTRKVETHSEKTNVNTESERETIGESSFKIKSETKEMNVEDFSDFSLSVKPNDSKEKKCSDRDIVYKDKHGRELRMPYENQTIDLNQVNVLKKEIKTKDSLILSQNKKIENLKSKISEQKKIKSKKSERENNSVWFFSVGVLVGFLFPLLIYLVYLLIKKRKI
ncbi:MAG: hypothetical protein CSA38_01935 [Flavobacteriales bacterium]|nr:MAG: hypothetical protein CSA38_01935 [Flavobacteriales bacterium]